MRALPQRVHAGVGATRSLDVHLDAEQARDHVLELLLHGVLAELALPALERRSLVGDGHEHAHAQVYSGP